MLSHCLILGARRSVSTNSFLGEMGNFLTLNTLYHLSSLIFCVKSVKTDECSFLNSRFPDKMGIEEQKKVLAPSTKIWSSLGLDHLSLRCINSQRHLVSFRPGNERASGSG